MTRMCQYAFMSFKHVLLLFLFVFNFASTVWADNSHFDLENVTHAEYEEHTHSDAADTDSEDHCPEDQCHAGHIHHYLMPLFSFVINFNVVFQGHLEHSFFVHPLFIEIVKPPLSFS